MWEKKDKRPREQDMLRWWAYFTWVGLVAGYGAECSWDYLLTFGLVNTYYTLGEYLFHRFTFHAPNTFPAITRIHAKHHQQPDHPNRLFIPIKVTLCNDAFLAGMVYLMGGSILLWLSAAHISYLLFEYAHYGTHSSDTGSLLPARLTAFHHYHHVVDSLHFAFTTPYWDILFGTTRHPDSFKLRDYPLSWLPLSVISFLSINELQVLTNLIYLWPAYGAWKKGWYDAGAIYLATGIVSAIHHVHHGQSRWWKLADYVLASLYFVVSVCIWWNTVYLSSWLVIGSCVLSLFLFVLDQQEEECGLLHIAWHLVTGLGVGYMISLVPVSSPSFSSSSSSSST